MQYPAAMQLRAALTLAALIVLAGCAGGDDLPIAATATPAASASSDVVVGDPTGEVIESDAAPSPSEAAATATPAPSPAPTPTPAVGTTAGWEVLACSSISGATCNGELGSLDGVQRFVALVRFQSASAGDAIEAVLDGPSGPISSGAYALQGGGAGYYYAEFGVGGLPPGNYVLTAYRNGAPVAERQLPGG